MFLKIKDRYVVTIAAANTCASDIIWDIPFVLSFHEFFRFYKERKECCASLQAAL